MASRLCEWKKITLDAMTNYKVTTAAGVACPVTGQPLALETGGLSQSSQALRHTQGTT